MFNIQGRIVRSVVVIATALGFGAGCGGAIDEPELTDAPAVTTQAATEEPPRKIDDLIAAFDDTQGVLYAVDSSQDAALSQLGARQTGTNQYEAKNVFSGEPIVFSIKPYPISLWPSLFKLCPNGQWVFSWVKCPTIVYQDTNLQVWKNSSCKWHVQSASTSSCTNTASGGSYNYQYFDAYKCGVGTGYCVNWSSVRTLRYDYNLLACAGPISNVTQYKDFLCKP